jgi:hypothetical protein
MGEQDDPVVPGPLVKMDRPFGGVLGEIGSYISELKRHVRFLSPAGYVHKKTLTVGEGTVRWSGLDARRYM